MNLLKKSVKRFPLFLIVAQPPFPVFFEVICSGAPLLSVTILGTVVVELPVKLEWKHTAVATRIPAMCVDSTVALLYPTPVSDKISPVIVDRALGNVIPEVRLGHLVPRVQVNPEIKRSMHEVRRVHPLAVDIVMINIVTPR